MAAAWIGLGLAVLPLRMAPARAAAPVGVPGGVPVQLLVLGDSLSAGYGLPRADGFEAKLGAALRARGLDVRIVDAAVSGDTSAGGLARLGWTLGGLAPGPVAALVELGANDGLRGLPTADLRRNLTAILDRLAARHIPVLLAGMEAPPNLGPGYAARFRAVYAALGRRPGVVLEPFFLAGVAEVPALVQADGLHPNAAGVRRVVATILPDALRVLRMAGKGGG
ncbi:MAG: arylesterase [Rhodospirillales bacterium]|nr:arylesterase [Rhodospirillales bacterium]